MTVTESKIAYRVATLEIIINCALFILKIIAGTLIHSVSMLSDALHSLSDIISTILVLLGIRITTKLPDKKHPFGYDKVEYIIAMVIGAMLLFVASQIGVEGIKNLTCPTIYDSSLGIYKIIAIVISVVSILCKEWMYRFTIKFAHKCGSKSMEADAWHQRVDAIASVGSLAGIIGLYLKLPIIDTISCFIISIFIIFTAVRIILDAVNGITDTSCNKRSNVL